MDQIPPPSALQLTGNVAENWKRFRQRFELYLTAIGAGETPDTQKIAILVTVAGPDATEVYNTFTYTDEEVDKYKVVLDKFEAYCVPRTNETYERFVFRSRLQRDGETVEQFVTDLKNKSKSCNYGTLKESLIRDQIVIGVCDAKVQERLLRDCELTLAKAIQICQAAETTNLQMKTLSLEAAGGAAVREQAVSAVKQKAGAGAGAKPKSAQKLRPQNSANVENSDVRCPKCGLRHYVSGRCPARGKTCFKCQGTDHFAGVCSFASTPAQPRPRVNVVAEDEDDADEFFVGAVNTDNSDADSEGEWISALVVNGSLVPFKLDTGAQVNVLPVKDFNALGKKAKLIKRTVKLRAYTGEPIPTLGVCRAELSCQGKKSQVMFVVVSGDGQPLLGLPTCEKLGLVKRVHVVNKEALNTEVGTGAVSDIVNEYNDVFQGLGCLPVTHKIQLRADAVPVIHAARRVPVALKEPLRQELERMVSLGVAEKVDEPTEWVSSAVIVEKSNGKLRVCLDPKDLNQYIKREHCQIPTPAEVTSEMAGATWFSKLDASSGFWQIPLDDESARLTTFNTPFGRYCYRRLPFGIASAPEVFHKTVQQLFEGIEGVRSIHDDIIVWGKTKAEHDERLKAAMAIARKANLKLNFDKCRFAVPSLTYMGEKLSADGVQPDPAKVAALEKMPVPECKADLQRYLGMVNFLGKFISNLSAKTTALRSLLENRTPWQWNHEHQAEWEQLQNILTREPVLRFFDPARMTKVSTDASKDGLGAVLLQLWDGAWLPVAYASRALTPAETRYAQIEKETLGIVFGCERFHEYVYGRPTVVETDHKPLIAIAKKKLCDLTPRIQRLMMKLLRYDVTFEYLPGKYLVVADTLSRAVPTRPVVSDTEDEVARHVHMVVENLPVSETKWAEFAEATKQDEQLQTVVDSIQNGWNPQVPCHPYDSFQGELTVLDGVVLRGTRIVVPTSMRSDMLERIHEGHLGIVKCRRRGREHFYWPSMNNDIEKLVSRCAVCQKYRYQQQKEPLKQHQETLEPWAKVGMDLFSLNGKDYMVVIDYMSNFPEVALLSGTSAKQVITHTKAIFARHGIPKVVISDNGPQFACQEFRDFAKAYEFEHVTSSPYYPQSNGMAEKGVQIAKRLLQKAMDTQSDPCLALLSYRTTPLDCGQSPAELLMNRKLRTRLPTVSAHKDTFVPSNKSKQKYYYDKAARSLEPLQKDDVVRMRQGASWAVKAQVLEEVAPRSYKVITEQGYIYRRNRKDLLKTTEHFSDARPFDFGAAELPGPVLKDNTVPVPADTALPTMPTGGSEPPTRVVPPPTRVVPPPVTVVPQPRRSGRSSQKPDRYIEHC